MLTIREKIDLLQSTTGKTQAELAREIKVTTLTLSNWYRGVFKPRNIFVQKIDKLIHQLGVDMENPSLLKAKKSAILELSKKDKKIIKTIWQRKDLMDELSLQITYNSNAIEGSTMTKEDTANVIFENMMLRNKSLNEQLEAKNHDKAFRYLIEHIYFGRKIDEALNKKLHQILMAGILDNPGSYRYHGVRIVGSNVPTANYLKVPNLMQDLFTQNISNDSIFAASAFHAKFEKIHPFPDGNGRIGRLLLAGMLLVKNIAPAIITKKNKPRYYKVLEQAKMHEIYDSLEDFVCDAVLRSYRIIQDPTY